MPSLATPGQRSRERPRHQQLYNNNFAESLRPESVTIIPVTTGTLCSQAKSLALPRLAAVFSVFMASWPRDVRLLNKQDTLRVRILSLPVCLRIRIGSTRPRLQQRPEAHERDRAHRGWHHQDHLQGSRYNNAAEASK